MEPPSEPSANLWLHPCFWSKADVHAWLRWCACEFSLAELDMLKFALNGKALMLLKKEDFMERAPYSGDVLYNTFQLVLRRHKDVDLVPSNAGGSLLVATHQAAASALLAASRTACLSRNAYPSTAVPAAAAAAKKVDTAVSRAAPLAQCRPPTDQPASKQPPQQQQLPSLLPQTTQQLEKVLGLSSSAQQCGGVWGNELQAATDESCNEPWLSADCRLLWEFISRLLADKRFETSIRWEDKDVFAFRIVNPARFAQLWGMQKNRGNMTYEKLSRALRYYYKMNIMEKIPGKRLTYRFLRSPTEIKQGRRGNPAAELPACSQQQQHSSLNFASGGSQQLSGLNLASRGGQQQHRDCWSPKREADEEASPLPEDPCSRCPTPYHDQDQGDADDRTDGASAQAASEDAERRMRAAASSPQQRPKPASQACRTSAAAAATAGMKLEPAGGRPR